MVEAERSPLAEPWTIAPDHRLQRRHAPRGRRLLNRITVKFLMTQLRAFLISFALTSFVLLGGHAVVADMLVPPPDVQIGPINISRKSSCGSIGCAAIATPQLIILSLSLDLFSC